MLLRWSVGKIGSLEMDKGFRPRATHPVKKLRFNSSTPLQSCIIYQNNSIGQKKNGFSKAFMHVYGGGGGESNFKKIGKSYA